MTCELSTESAELDEFNSTTDGDEAFILGGTDYSDRHQIWLTDIIPNARTPSVDLSEFSGDT